MKRHRNLMCVSVGALVCLIGCAQMVRIEVKPGGDKFVVEQAKPGMDRRYDSGGRKTEFSSGALVPIDKGAAPKIRVVNRAGLTVWEEYMKAYPMKWYETLLTPLFGLGYLLYAPYADPYVVEMDKGDILLRTAQELATEILSAIPPSAKVVGFPYIESTDAENGAPHVSEGNRKLSEYVCNTIRDTEMQDRDLREYKYGIDYYLRHTSSGLGAAAAPRRELFTKFAADEKLDVIVYGKNYVHMQKVSGDKQGKQPEQGILNCRVEFDILDGKTGATLRRVKYPMALGIENWEMSKMFLPSMTPGRAGAAQADGAPTIEVALERAAQRLSRDILDRITQGNLLGTYNKPVPTYVADFGYLVRTDANEPKTQANKYGHYIAEKVSMSLLSGSGGMFMIVSPKRIKTEMKSLVERRSALYDEDDAPTLGRRRGAKVTFRGDMVKVGADLNMRLWIQDDEQGITHASVEYKLPLSVSLDEQLQLGNQD